MSWAYVQEPASNNKRLWHYVAYCEVTTSPCKEDVGYTDVEKLTHP